MDYHERLKTLNTYSLERRREHFFIQNAWQQIEGKKENILGLETGDKMINDNDKNFILAAPQRSHIRIT